MPRYYTDLKVTKITKNTWEVIEDWHTPFITVPKGFRSDGASVPRPLWWFLSPAGELFEAAILHDYLYNITWTIKRNADNAFRDTALSYGANKFKVYLAHKAVCRFGEGNYFK